ncbi:hypothetical protein BD309DRAFT_863644 [Dichomitus squalens]|uniref:Uncharacterized protein n=1 Tax=Dichomitus squalens TaxID=114155 RepID=A0A4Q9NQE5_9APHY|nr:hypothetical protein BD309DRAFT_863644 [Dichomitus squalens]TBU55549.1 hypothetical protein BD310DRAFT_825521 [Dichomitus squalens]
MSAPSAYEDDGGCSFPFYPSEHSHPLCWEGIMVVTIVTDAHRFHPSRAEASYLAQSCGHCAKMPDGNLRQGKWGDTQTELSRTIGYVFAPLYSNIQRNTLVELSGSK